MQHMLHNTMHVQRMHNKAKASPTPNPMIVSREDVGVGGVDGVGTSVG